MAIKRKHMWTAVLLTLLICIVVAAVGLSYLTLRSEAKLTDLENQITELKKSSTASESSAVDTSDWKTYKNDEFSFKYPADYFAYDTCYNNQTKKREAMPMVTAAIEKDQDSEGILCATEYMSLIFNITRITQDSVGLNAAVSQAGLNKDDYTISEIKVDGEKALVYAAKTNEGLFDAYINTIYVANQKGDVYQISWQNSDAKGTAANQYSDAILNTLNFK